MTKTVEIYIQLLADEKGTLRPTQAIPLANEAYKVLPIPNYDRVGETWEFPPGSIVRCDKKMDGNKEYLLAVEKAG